FEMPEAPAQGLAVTLRDDQLDRIAPDGLIARPAERLFGADVPVGDAPFIVHRDEGAVGDVEDLASAVEIHARDYREGVRRSAGGPHAGPPVEVGLLASQLRHGLIAVHP